MTLVSSVALLVVVFAAIGLLAFACCAPRKKSRSRPKPQAPDLLADPPTITHYGHA